MMKFRVFKKLRKSVRRQLLKVVLLDSKVATLIGLALLGLMIWGGNMAYTNYQLSQLDPTAYRPLLETIAKGESRGNYNAYWGNVNNDKIRFTDMPIGEVLQWQADYVKDGSPSSAVGKYQIVRPTLAGLVSKFRINPSAKFDAGLQDRLAVALLEKRGVGDYQSNRLSRSAFAANLAKEWAALPKATGPRPDQSYYAGDGLNKAQISTAEVFLALDHIKK